MLVKQFNRDKEINFFLDCFKTYNEYLNTQVKEITINEETDDALESELVNNINNLDKEYKRR